MPWTDLWHCFQCQSGVTIYDDDLSLKRKTCFRFHVFWLLNHSNTREGTKAAHVLWGRWGFVIGSFAWLLSQSKTFKRMLRRNSELWLVSYLRVRGWAAGFWTDSFSFDLRPLQFADHLHSPLSTGRVPSSRRVPSGRRVPVSVKVEKETLRGVGVVLPSGPPGKLHQQPERRRHTLHIRAAAGRWYEPPCWHRRGTPTALVSGQWGQWGQSYTAW